MYNRFFHINSSLSFFLSLSFITADLRLNNNKLYGSLPDVTTFAPLPLKVLMISGNALDGSIPNSMLRLLDLSKFTFSVYIFPSFSAKRVLVLIIFVYSIIYCNVSGSINLSDNFLTGSIPFLGELPFLEKLSLNDNSLSGAGLSNLLSRAPLSKSYRTIT